MAPPTEKASAPPPPKKKQQFEKKSAGRTVLAVLGIPFSLAVLFLGSIGLLVMNDMEGELASSKIGEITKTVTNFNFTCLAIFFNGGLIGLLASLIYLGELRSESRERSQKLLTAQETKKGE